MNVLRMLKELYLIHFFSLMLHRNAFMLATTKIYITTVAAAATATEKKT